MILASILGNTAHFEDNLAKRDQKYVQFEHYLKILPTTALVLR